MAGDRKREICLAVIAGAIAAGLFCFVMHIWNMDLSIPLEYSGDVFGALTNIKTVQREEAWSHMTALSAPFSTNQWRQLADGIIPNLIIYGLAKCTNGVGYSINLFYIFSYMLSAICTYYMLRKAKVSEEFSFVGAILYALIPGHFLRGEKHIYVGSCFLIPLMVSVFYEILSDDVCLKRNKQKKHLLIFAGISLFTIYYGIFSLMILTFCCLYRAIATREIKYLYGYLQYIVVELCCVFVIYLPQMIANRTDPLVADIHVVTRTIQDTEVYGGKLIQYILPVSGHRISFLAGLRELYDTTHPLVNENSMSSLGLIMSIGFVAGVMICLFRIRFFDEDLVRLGHLEVFLFFLSTIGGLGAMVGMVNHSLRCYNRISFFIGAAGLIIFMRILQYVHECLLPASFRKGKGMLLFLGIFILGIGVFDQTTGGKAYSKEYSQSVRYQYDDDETFVREIEEYEGEGANILVLPSEARTWQEDTSYVDEWHNPEYDKMTLFLHSQTSNWSINGKPGEFGERWLYWLDHINPDMQIRIAKIAGYDGIAVYSGEYTDEGLKKVDKVFRIILKSPTIENRRGTWRYYSLGDIKEKDAAEWKEKILNVYPQYIVYNVETGLKTDSENADSDNGKIHLGPNDVQYGPYGYQQDGEYEIVVSGKNLSDVKVDCVSQTGGKEYDIDILEQRDERVCYKVVFAKPVDDVEFRTFNMSESEEAMIEKVEVSRMIEGAPVRLQWEQFCSMFDDENETY